jgi:hypothetical protein
VPFYRCLVRGENFPGEIIGEAGIYGFYTTRWIQALNEKRAELRAVEALRRDPKLALPRDFPVPANSRVYVERIQQVSRLPRMRGGGATWFRQEEGSDGI